MVNDRTTGNLLLIFGLAGIILYSWLLSFFNTDMTTLILQITTFLAVAIIFAIIIWIGYIMITTTSPEPLNTGNINETFRPIETKNFQKNKEQNQ